MRTARGRLAVLTAAATLTGSILAAPAEAAPKCFGKRPTIIGTDGSDRINGTARADVILGLAGGDRISGRGRNDRICGGDGRDRLTGKGGNDQLSGGSGSDRLLAHSGNDRLVGGSGGDSMEGADGNDKHSGGSGSDYMIGGLGDDLYLGGQGQFDTASFFRSPVGVVVDLANPAAQDTAEGIDTLTGVEGVQGSQHNDVLKGDDLDLQAGNGLFGVGGTDQILGLGDDDFVEGGPGNDEGVAFPPGSLNGGAGNDIICGDFCEFPSPGDGDDDLYGDAGDDLLDGGANVTAAGDLGDGGDGNDTCLSVEANANCESFTPPPGPRASHLLARSRTALSAWASVRALRR
jgi:Ca2+-binding RTX toxin-like protein